MKAYSQYFEESEDADPGERAWWENRGIPDHEVSATIDVSDFANLKIEALKAHRSQIPADWMMLRVPEEARAQVFGNELFQRIFSTVDSPLPESDLFAGLR
jgi:mycothiol S-conjugate amidase